MSRQTCVWPYDQLRIGDWVCCGGDGFFPAITRVVTGDKSKSIIKRWRDRSVSTHTGLLFGIGRQLLVAEMTAPRIVISSLEVQYRERGRRVICFRRPVVKNVDAYRTAVQEAVGELYRRGEEYDYKGLLEFVSRRVKDSSGRMYCSEMVYTIARDHVSIPFPVAYGVKVSPQDLNTCEQATTVWTAPA